jgi:SAM-dependent methyltransferase
LAKSSDADDLREHILTGYKSGKPFTPYIPTLDLPRPIGRALDFGCGLGRSFSYLKTIATHVTGFDLPPMVERCRALAPQPADALLDNWAEARVERFDLIYSALVLQHIETDACRAYLEDFARMAPVVYLLTRTMSDFEVNVLDLAASTGLFDAGECVEVDHDPATNQLRVLGRRALENVRRSPEPGHYEVMLSSRVG